MSSQSVSESSVKTWPVRMVDHVSMYSRILYDIDGKILVNRKGILLNVYKTQMDDAFRDKDIRVYRNSTMNNVCYRYFVTSQDQLETFWNERVFGTNDGPNKAFHVYVDDDVDRTCSEYKNSFRLAHELDNGLPTKVKN